MKVSFHNAKIQFERLVDEHRYSNRQIALLTKEFEQGRQLYLNLRAAAETVQYERDITKSESVRNAAVFYYEQCMRI
jgi:hemerythrin-like domain-containing protein